MVLRTPPASTGGLQCRELLSLPGGDGGAACKELIALAKRWPFWMVSRVPASPPPTRLN